MVGTFWNTTYYTTLYGFFDSFISDRQYLMHYWLNYPFVFV